MTCNINLIIKSSLHTSLQTALKYENQCHKTHMKASTIQLAFNSTYHIEASITIGLNIHYQYTI